MNHSVLKLFTGLLLTILFLAPTVGYAVQKVSFEPGEDLQLSRSEYKKNEHAKQLISKTVDEYRFQYTFRDHQDIDWVWKWSYPKEITDKAIEKYGIPPQMFEPFPDTPEEHARRKEVLKAGMHQQNRGVITPDFNALIEYYLPFATPLYQLLEKTTAGKPREDKIETLLRFVQDIPYGIPEGLFQGRHISGLIVPPHTLIAGWGDCDTKTALFAAILAHYQDVRMIFIPVPNHLLMAIEGVPGPGQEYVHYKGKQYIFAAPVGPGRFEYGSQGEKKYTDFLEVIEIKPFNQLHPVIQLRPQAVSAEMDFNQKRLFLVEEKREKGQVIKTYRDARNNNLKLEKSIRKGNQLQLILSSKVKQAVIADLKAGEQSLKNQVLVQPEGDQITVLAKVYQPFDYKLQIFAKSSHNSGKYPFVFDYLFQEKKRYPVDHGYPEAYGDFNKRNARLIQPLAGALKYKSRVRFEVEIPKAEKAAVIIGKKWHYLKKNGKLFTGEILVNGGPAVLSANFGRSNSFASLLKYQVIR